MNETFANQIKAAAVTNTQEWDNAFQAIKNRQWVVGSVNERGDFSMSPSPVFHLSAASASAEARRLAQIKPGVTFVSMRLSGGMLVPKVTGVAEF